MVIKHIFSGFAVKVIAGFDDTMTHIPIIGNMTRTQTGRIAFAIGMFFAIASAITISYVFGSTIKGIPYARYISATLIFLLAMSIYFQIFITKPKELIKEDLKKIKSISTKRFLKLVGIGFVAAIATIIDDTIAYSGLFLGTAIESVYVVIGIFFATIIQLTVVVKFANTFNKIPYKRQITSVGLVILSILVLFGIL
ncbi:MAG: hypothetical protein ABIA78_00700 [archaeon]